MQKVLQNDFSPDLSFKAIDLKCLHIVNKRLIEISTSLLKEIHSSPEIIREKLVPHVFILDRRHDFFHDWVPFLGAKFIFDVVKLLVWIIHVSEQEVDLSVCDNQSFPCQ
jgi:hypothetical protein